METELSIPVSPVNAANTLNTRKCQKCKKPNAQSTCGKCNRVYYCGRECQLAEWSQHKRNCYSLEQQQHMRSAATDSLFASITKKIAGNVIILNAWYRESRGYIEVQISESLDELLLSSPGSHFLHLKYVVEDSSIYDAHSEPDKCIVVYKLNDLTRESVVAIRLSSSQVKEKQKQPTQEWSIMTDF